MIFSSSTKAELKDKVIVCTGGTGFIGSHLLASLANSGARIISLSRQPIKQILSIEELTADFFTLTQDFWAENGIQTIDAFIHLAGFIPKDVKMANNIERAYQDNIKALHILLESLPNTKRIIFASTIDVYGQHSNNQDINEDTLLSPQNLYAVSKLYGENLITTWAKEKKTTYAILRYGHIYGPGEGIYRKFIPLTISNILNNKPVLIYGTGTAKRDFLYVDDAVEATLRSVISDKDINKVNIVSGSSVTIAEITEMIIHIAQSEISVIYDLDKPNGQSLSFDNRYMHECLGKWETTCLEKGLKNEIKHMKDE